MSKEDGQESQAVYDKLVTAEIEVESVINFKPLSYVTSNELKQPLTRPTFIVEKDYLASPMQSTSRTLRMTWK